MREVKCPATGQDDTVTDGRDKFIPFRPKGGIGKGGDVVLVTSFGSNLLPTDDIVLKEEDSRGG